MAKNGKLLNSDPANMMSSVDADDDYLDDPIKLNFDENAPRLENVKFLDPGIIDNGCESRGDFQLIDEDTFENNLTGDTTSLESVTTAIPNNDILKPMCIKLVDCYKFPWYFDQFTKDIKNKLIISNIVNVTNSEPIVDISSNDLNNVYELTDDNTFCESISINEKSRDTIDVNSYELNNDSHNWEKPIGMNRINESLGIKMRVIDHSKRLAKIKRKHELELQKAMSQRNKTGVDIKKNIGLVGMKVKHMTTGRKTSDIKYKTKNQTDSNKNISQETNNVHLEAVDKALIDNKTTVTPVFKEVGRSTNESEISKLTVPGSSSDSVNRFAYSLIDSKLLECEKSGTDMKYILAHRDKVEEDMLEKINRSTEIAKEIVRIISSESDEICQINEGHKNDKEKKNFSKPMPYSKKIENELKLRRLDVIKNTLKQQKDTKECKTTKMITPIPLSTKARNREKQPKSIKRYEVQETKSTIQSLSSAPKSNTTNITSTCTKSHDVKKQESEKTEISKVNPFKPISPYRRSDTNIPSKSFTTLNKFTEKILSKIQATKKSQLNKINNLDKEHTKNKNHVVQPNSTNECKLLSSVLSTISNVTNEKSQVEKIAKMASPYTQPLDKTTKNLSTESKSDITMSPKMTLTQPQYWNENNLERSPKRNRLHLDNHFKFPYHIEQNTLPLNTIVMNTAKTDCAKIHVETSRHVVKDSHDYATNSKSPGNISQTNEEQITTNITGASRSQKALILEDIRNIEENMKTKENLNQPLVSQGSPSNTATPILKDKFTIQTVITTPNELDAGEVSNEVNNLTHQTHAPKTQVSAIIIRPTQTQNRLAEANKPLTVHNSMQSHILYRPQAENRSPSKILLDNVEALQYQNPMPQMNRPVYQPHVNLKCYPSWCPERITPHTGRSPNGLNGSILAHVTSDTSKTTAGNEEQITPKLEMNLKSLEVDNGTPPQSTLAARQMPQGFKGQIPLLMGTNVRNDGGIPPYAVINNSRMPARDNGTVTQEIKARPAVNRTIPMHNNMGLNNRPTSPGVCYMQPNTVFWSPAFPPPTFLHPPPVFLPPCFQKTMPMTSNSIIGRNNEGDIKKINISTQVFDNSTKTNSKQGIFKSGFALDVLSVAQENSRLATTKSEMLRVLDTSMHRMQSPVDNSENTASMPSKPLAGPNGLKSSLHLPSSERLAKMSKHEKSHHNVQPIPFDPNKNKNTKLEVLPHSTPNKEAALKKITVPVEAKIHRKIQSKTPQIKSNRSSDTHSSRLFEDNLKSDDSLQKTLTDTSRLEKVIHSKEIPIKSEVYMQNNKRESRQIENSVKPDINSQRTVVASPVNLKRVLPMDQTKNTSSTAKYKPGPLSKRNKFYDSKGSPNEIKTEQNMLPNKGYSAPILPIPTYEKILSELPAAGTQLFDRPVVEPSQIRMSSDKADTKTKRVSHASSNKPIKKRKHLELNSHKVDKAKKISLEEYKKRSGSERKTDRAKFFKGMKNDSCKKNTAHIPRRRPSYVDSDLGYDSDSTVKL